MKSTINALLCFTIALSISCNLAGQEPRYKVSDIPSPLLANAKAVVRNMEAEVEVFSPDKAVIRYKSAVTIMNQNGVDHSVFYYFYNKFSSVRKVDWSVYNAEGLPVRLGSDVELQDYSAISGFSAYEDSRVKFLDPKYRTTPFTVEYSYEVNLNGYLNLPSWNLYEDYNVSVEKSVFRLITPAGLKIRIKERNVKDPCSLSNEKDKAIYTWKAMNMQALREESYGVTPDEYTPVVELAPVDFNLDNRPGKMDNWKEYGKWIYSLNEGRDILSPETTQKVKALVQDCKSDKEKIQKLYSYMQNKVRYVNVSVGIGGWQPIEAGTIDRLSYGDCKALSNYMKSLLDAAGIKSLYAIVYAGENEKDILVDFPSNHFNHAILCVPGSTDTTWLECTNQKFPAGFIGSFTDDRHVLLIEPDGGKLVKTRKYSASENCQSKNANVILSPNADARAEVHSTYIGVQSKEIYPVFDMDREDQKKFLQRRIRIKSFEITDFRHKENKALIPSIEENISMDLRSYCTVMGERMILNPNLMTRISPSPVRTSDRKSSVRIRRPYMQADTITFKLPDGYKVEKLPGKIEIQTKFGNYSAELTNIADGFRYIRSFNLFKGEYKPEEFDAFASFLEKVISSDEKKISLLKSI